MRLAGLICKEIAASPRSGQGWDSVTKLAGGAGTVTSNDRVTDQGLFVRKSFAGAGGKEMFRFEVSLKPISPKAYDNLQSRLAPAGTR